MPLHPDFAAELRASSELDEVIAAWKRFNAEHVLQSLPMPREPITSGSGIAILVDFDDNQADTINHPPAEYDTLLFSEGLLKTGSMKDFYIENSYGQFEFSGEPSPHPESGRAWHRLAGSYDYWSENFGFNHSGELAQAAVEAADPHVDFGKFDNDGPDGIPNSGDDDGAIDAVYVVHAGPGYEEGHCGKIWSHMSVTYYETDDDAANGGKIRLERYSIQPEERCSGALINMGVFAHEYGHILGLPDLYDYGYDSKGMGRWTIMAGGSWNNGGASPAHFDAWCKSRLGWVHPINVTDFEIDAEFPAVEFDSVVYRLWTDGDTTSKEYFLVENRQKLGLFDSYLPGEGLLVYHVDDWKSNNNNQYIPGEHAAWHHFRVALEQADGRFDLERNSNSGDLGDPFPGSSARDGFAGFLPYPTSRNYYEEDTKVGVLSISSSDSLMYANLDVGRHLPYFRLLSVQQFGGSDAKIEPGEQGSVVVTLENIWGKAQNLEAELSIDNQYVQVTKATVSIGPVDEDETCSNISDPFIVAVEETAPGYIEVTAKLLLRETTTGAEQHFSFPITFGWPGLLVVNDAADEWLTASYEDVLRELNVLYETTTPSDLSILEDMLIAQGTHDSVLIWFTGQETSTLSEEEENLLSDFVAAGGKLLISSQNLGEDRGSSGFYRDVLHANFETADESEIIINSAGEGPLLSADEKIAVASAYGTSKDGITAREGALPVVRYSDGNTGALTVEDQDARIVYLAFPFEGLSGDPSVVVREKELMRRILLWFGYAYLDVAEEAGRTSSDEVEMLSSVVHSGKPALMRLSLAAESPLELALYDAVGREAARISLGVLQPGEHALEIPTRGLPCGVYFVGIKTAASSRTARLVVIE